MSEKMFLCDECPKNGDCKLQENPTSMTVVCSSCHKEIAEKFPNEPPLILMFHLLIEDSYVCQECLNKAKSN